jgi:hypothetical protein
MSLQPQDKLFLFAFGIVLLVFALRFLILLLYRKMMDDWLLNIGIPAKERSAEEAVASAYWKRGLPKPESYGVEPYKPWEHQK